MKQFRTRLESILIDVDDRVTAVLISGHLGKLGQIVDSIYKKGLKITKMRKVELSSQEAFKLMESERDTSSFKLDILEG